MNADIVEDDDLHLVGDRATHPMAPRWGWLAALLLLVGKGPPRRPALPATPSPAPSGASNCRFQVQSEAAQDVKKELSPAPNPVRLDPSIRLQAYPVLSLPKGPDRRKRPPQGEPG